MVTLAVTAGNSSQQIITVRGGSTSGFGQGYVGEIRRRGAFTVDARKTGDGAAISRHDHL